MINMWLNSINIDIVDIGYDLKYDEGYIENELGCKLYESDFD